MSRHFNLEWFDPPLSRDYHKTCASKPGDRCLALALRIHRGWQGRGRGKSELRRAVCSLTARAGGGFLIYRDVRLRYGKCHRKYTAAFVAFGLQDAVRVKRCGPGQPGIKVRAHRLGGDTEGMVNPTRSKTK